MAEQTTKQASSSSSAASFRRERPNKLMRFLFKVPVYFYWGPFARLFAWRCVLRVTTVGRKSGKLRRTCISFMPYEGNYVVFAGWGVVADWYRNALANPRVKLDIGGKTINAEAHPVEDPERRKELMLQMRDCSEKCGPPKFTRPLLALTGTFDYDAEIRMAVEHAEELPVIEMVPEGGSPVASRSET